MAFHSPLTLSAGRLTRFRTSRRLRFEQLEDRRILAIVPGDYSRDGVVDSADFIIWRHTLGETVTDFDGADGNGSGNIDEGDYEVWKVNFGRFGPPEPVIRFANLETLAGPKLLLEIIGTATDDNITVTSDTAPRDIHVMFENALGASLERIITETS